MVLIAVGGAVVASTGAVPPPVSFNRDIRPILSANCFQCHGPDAAARQANLQLDDRVAALRPRRSGRSVIVPGHPERSLLLERVEAHEAVDRMPPPETNKRLTADEVARLRRWIDEGASYETHWSFVPPVRPAVPVRPGTDAHANPIDAFVGRRVRAAGLTPASPAEPALLLRRVTLDLTGLPPTQEELDAVDTHATPAAAYEAAVDRLLASPRFGERMAVPWLDVARYADSFGYQSDQLSPTWPYRDWVVRAFNRNLPFDEFIRWQIAGDLLPGATREQRLATAFNRLHRMTNEGGSVEEEWRLEYVADRVQTYGTAFLGLTFQCARCHDHKFDPITTREYYGLTAFFNSIDEWGMYLDSARVPTPALLLPTEAQSARLATLEETLAEADATLRAVHEERQAAFAEWLESGPTPPAPLPGLVGRYPLDAIGPDGHLANDVDAGNPGTTAAVNTLVAGVHGSGLRFTGDDAASFPKVAGGLKPWDAFTIGFWLRVPAGMPDCIIAHRSAGTDVGRPGTELSLKDGRLFFGLIRFWPGNAIAIGAVEPLATDAWAHVAVTYDGSGRAAGIRLFVDGRPVTTRVVRDRLTKDPGVGGDGITFGQRFRDRGLAGGVIDDVNVFDRALASVEVRHLVDGVTLTRALADGETAALRAYYAAAIDDEVAAARVERSEAVRALLEHRTGFAETMVMEESAEPRAAYVLPRGAYDAPKTAANRVERGTPAALPPMPDDAPRDRLGLARWTTAADHPLTARVIVNRLWQMFFGRGLVATSEDFGAQGAYPDAPELLDWLAVEFVESGWDLKVLCRRIVMSATYRQSSALRGDLARRDPDNTLLTRGPARRLSAEMLRDLALSVSGLLDETRGGPPVSPYQPAGLWREANTMSPAYRQSVGTALYRRSLYTVWKRTAPMPNMMALDATTREVCTPRRETTSSPIQALVLLNDPQFVEAARVAGERMVRSGGDTDATRIAFMFRLCTGRRPTAAEAALLAELARDQRTRLAADPDAAAGLLRVGDHPADDALDPVEVATAAVVAQTILNMDATVWKR
ncbi:MAG: DUF1553 domain-containing protein [Phycisphaerales bacterium]|nr:DUF1553 domain-containing protein [Phycisphaerales bacterium]